MNAFPPVKKPKAYAMSRAAPGHDGNPPEFREARDIEGKGKRKSALGPQNIRVDRLEWLLAHRRIDLAQHAAGRRLQHDWELALIGGYASPDASSGGPGSASGVNRLADVKCDAIARVNAARGHVGGKGWRILELVAVQNVSLGEAALRMRESPDRMQLGLSVALDALASHYRLA
jgi:hypothetical protein